MTNDDYFMEEVHSALDLAIKGSMGSFSVGHDHERSVTVQYLQTHVGLALKGDHEEKLLRVLAPVREVFETRRLDFEQIMQRDIDDARVSAELVPYLLESGHSGLVKLFPPIIVVVLPTDNGGLPAPSYPKVDIIGPQPDEKPPRRKWRSGPVGSEVFELSVIETQGKPHYHYDAQLRLNTSRAKLVIVDGQHRAMALLALYRNLKGWPEKTRSFTPYYKIWSESYIKSYDLNTVRLPVMFCVFPELDGEKDTSIKVHEACRSIFLALNKNAKKVTRARNYLLDDRDVVSALMRSLLTRIKALDSTAEVSMRLWSMELDSDEDKTVLTSPIAISGVTHLFGLVERLMLGNPPPVGLGIPRQNLWLKTALDRCFERLDLADAIPKETKLGVRRQNCDRATLDTLVHAFDERYGDLIVAGLATFAPYEASHAAALSVHTRLSTDTQGEFYSRLFFEGEGMVRVFKEFREKLETLIKDSQSNAAEWKSFKSEFADREKRVKEEIEKFQRARGQNLLRRLPEWFRDLSSVQEILNETGGLYSGTFTTAAFQNALFLTFFAVIESINADRRSPPTPTAPLTSPEVKELFDRYIDDLNTFFRPKDIEGFQRVVAALAGELKVDEHEKSADLVESVSLRDILIPGELKPDEWAKFRAMLIEIWKPSNKDVKAKVLELRDACRRQALERYVRRRIREHCIEHGVKEEKLAKDTLANIKHRCTEQYLVGLEALGQEVSSGKLLETLDSQPPESGEEGNSDD